MLDCLTDTIEDEEDPDNDYSEDYEDPPQCPENDQPDTVPKYSLSNIERSQNAIASTFRGFCCDHFVFGRCTKKDCIFDHSSKGQEMCQQSFHLLAKRNLTEHGNLPPYSKTKDISPLHRPYPLTPTNRPYVPMTPRPHSTPTPIRFGNK